MGDSSSRGIKSFTLVELLIVIAILAILAAAVVIVLNPAELLAQARDSQRVTDLKNIKKSIDLFVVDNPTVSLGTASRVYISLPDTASNCPNLTSSLPTLPSGWQYVCSTSANLRNTNGSGWIPVNFGSVFGGSPIPYLPIDPSNDLSSGRYYTYVMGGSYELTALMEAVKENVSVNDGGSLPGVFQVGTHIDLTPPTRDKGLVGYWTFDEGTGTVAYDSSGKGNTGTWQGTGVHYDVGKVGSYSGKMYSVTSDFLAVPNSVTVNNQRKITISGWMKPSSWHHVTTLVGKGPEIATQHMWVGWWGTSTRMSIEVGDGSGYINYSGSSGLTWTDNIWYFIAVTFDDESKIYNFFQNGDLAGSGSYSGRSFNSGEYNISIGSYASGTGHNIDGLLDDIRIYNRALSASEVKAIYEATK